MGINIPLEYFYSALRAPLKTLVTLSFAEEFTIKALF